MVDSALLNGMVMDRCQYLINVNQILTRISTEQCAQLIRFPVFGLRIDQIR